ncbi:Short chain dehydrogenase [Schizosaccharomyces pombe]|uniref:Uncharacterized oxidoreductase C1739.08c n=1 Tax=Schizosaccharomyces pombe (strain 972 / ATCC 24843) TaxID=284812 RepID=YQC8_SCHPO|nr:putative dehydrogenase [Schizosaccharomyces pombe]O74470.1 RecName: Full=Uncharacterized oxidoreductase C1739.08c [Schizosaccharomyces pombe 972h-]CAA20782.1 short chain dehydrogenase (predicted) [Schizosaccharomyces pombe]|eukprot:NP_588416.1 putative dehydrogenase [Schizosaccharomyces pombe]
MSTPPANVTTAHVLDLFSLKGKNCVVFGAAKGIGFSIATAFAQAGGNVIITYLTTDPTEKAKKLAEETGVQVHTLKIDISRSDTVEAGVEEIQKIFKEIHVVVANAGMPFRRSVLDSPPHEFEKVMNINTNSVYRVAYYMGKIFKKQGFGNLIATASMSATIVNAPQHIAAYCASKAAVRQLCKALAVEWAEFARINSVSPGYFATDMPGYEFLKQWEPYVPFKRLGLTPELRGTYLYLASNASSFVTGLDLIVDGGYTCL